ncbi:MAG: hypothetical protein IT376_16290 [Polyangiaceae bacterium]|nr:hypothetical protein [Polyangiaceae bacterium]
MHVLVSVEERGAFRAVLRWQGRVGARHAALDRGERALAGDGEAAAGN